MLEGLLDGTVEFGHGHHAQVDPSFGRIIQVWVGEYLRQIVRPHGHQNMGVQPGKGRELGQKGHQCDTLVCSGLRKDLLELVDDQEIDLGCRGASTQEPVPGREGKVRVRGPQPQLVEGISQLDERLLRGSYHRPAQCLVAFGVVGFECGQQPGLGEGGFATATRAGDEEQDLLGTRGRQFGQRRTDLGLSPGVLVSLIVGKRRQPKVGVGEPAYIVGHLTVIVLMHGTFGSVNESV